MEKQILARGTHLTFCRRSGWEFVERNGVTHVVALLAEHDGRIILIEQLRPILGRRVVELPAGLGGDVEGMEAEDVASAAARELFEETGYEADRYEVLTAGPTSAGLTDELITFVRATGLRRAGPGGGDAHEDIEVHEVPAGEVDAWLRAREAAGRLVDPKIYTALYFLRAGG